MRHETVTHGMRQDQYVWDLPLRCFHWLLVSAVVGSYVTIQLGAEWLYWHIHIGIFIVTLLMFRLCWGLLGPPTARFTTFFPTPKRIRHYYLSPFVTVGHSPHAALSVFALLLVSFMQTMTGMFALDDEIDIHGPLYNLVSSSTSNTLTSLHTWLFNLLLLLIGLHLLAIGYYLVVKRQNVLRPMLIGFTTQRMTTGTPTRPDGNNVALVISLTLPATLFWSIESDMLMKWLTLLLN